MSDEPLFIRHETTAIDYMVMMSDSRIVEMRLPCGCWIRPCNPHGKEHIEVAKAIGAIQTKQE